MMSLADSSSVMVVVMVVVMTAAIVTCHLVVVQTAVTMSTWQPPVPSDYSNNTHEDGSNASSSLPEVGSNNKTRIAVIGAFSSCDDEPIPDVTNITVLAAVAAYGGDSRNYNAVDSCDLIDVLVQLRQTAEVPLSSYGAVVGPGIYWMCDAPLKIFEQVGTY